MATKQKMTKMFTILVLALGLMVWLVEVSEAAPMGTAFTYQGRLIDANSVADGLYDLQFKLYDANNSGSQLSSDVNTLDVDVIDGYFTVELDFGSDVFDGSARWLEIGVRPGELNDPNTYTVLTPRQEITPVPYALQTRGIFVDKAGNVGIGTTSPDSKLEVTGSSSDPIIYGTNSGSGNGVRGVSTSGSAVAGYSESYIGVLGYSVTENGVEGESATHNGVEGHGGRCDFLATGPGEDYCSTSSIRWKSDVQPIDDPLEKVLRLRGVYFNWDTEHGGHHDVGMIAEEVGEVLPEIVEYEEDGIYTTGMDYSKLTPLLVEAVKTLKRQTDEQQKQLAEKDGVIDTLKQQNDKLEGRLAVLESSITTIAVRLEGGGK